jgi:hypothetical protein
MNEVKTAESHQTLHQLNERNQFLDLMQKESSDVWSISFAFRNNSEAMNKLGEEIQDDFDKLLKADSIEAIQTHSHDVKSKSITFISKLINECELHDHFQIRPLNKE